MPCTYMYVYLRISNIRAVLNMRTCTLYVDTYENLQLNSVCKWKAIEMNERKVCKRLRGTIAIPSSIGSQCPIIDTSQDLSECAASRLLSFLISRLRFAFQWRTCLNRALSLNQSMSSRRICQITVTDHRRSSFIAIKTVRKTNISFVTRLKGAQELTSASVHYCLL